MARNPRMPSIMGLTAAAMLLAPRDPVAEAVRKEFPGGAPQPPDPQPRDQLAVGVENSQVIVRIPEITNVLGFTADQAFQFARMLIAKARGIGDVPALGLLPTQEPKYDVTVDGKIVNRATGGVIPDDEPVFILRAKDRHAVSVLEGYRDRCWDQSHVAAVNARIEQFKAFRLEHEGRIQEPTT